jgi:hypothetical protein
MKQNANHNYRPNINEIFGRSAVSMWTRCPQFQRLSIKEIFSGDQQCQCGLDVLSFRDCLSKKSFRAISSVNVDLMSSVSETVYQRNLFGRSAVSMWTRCPQFQRLSIIEIFSGDQQCQCGLDVLSFRGCLSKKFFRAISSVNVDSMPSVSETVSCLHHQG